MSYFPKEERRRIPGLFFWLAFLYFEFKLEKRLCSVQGAHVDLVDKIIVHESGETEKVRYDENGNVASLHVAEPKERTSRDGLVMENIEITMKHEAVQTHWKKHVGLSCQGYAEGDATSRSLSESKRVCPTNSECVAIECGPPSGDTSDCTLRSSANLVPWVNSQKKPMADCYVLGDELDGHGDIQDQKSWKLHPVYEELIERRPFKPVRNQRGQNVNVIIVQSPMGSNSIDWELFKKYNKSGTHRIFTMINCGIHADGRVLLMRW